MPALLLGRRPDRLGGADNLREDLVDDVNGEDVWTAARENSIFVSHRLPTISRSPYNDRH